MFDKTVITHTFLEKKYPFMQILYPTPSTSGIDGYLVYEKIMDSHLKDIN